MARPRLYTAYSLTVAIVGIGLAVLTTLVQAPHDVRSWTDDVVSRGLILLALTFLSSLSPMKTRSGASVTVGLAPLFGALLVLPPWAMMWVAALGTMDERLPGKRIPWSRFLFSRGMFALVYGLPSLALAQLNLVPVPTSLPVAWFVLQPVLVVAVVAVNFCLVAGFFSLLDGSSFWHLVRNAIAGSWLTYIALPIIGYLIVVFLLQPMPVRLVVFLLYGPLLVYRTSLQKQNRLDQWLRDSFIMQSRVVDKRDGQTFGHSQRVGELCETIARMMHLSEDDCNTIRVGGILHDLGKIAIPDSILLKPGKLTPEEYEIIKTHPVEGAQILAEHPEQKDVSEIVMHHHERWDGKGYPDGLKGEEIPLGSRIVNACDAFDTITQARVFRPTVKTPTEAITELRQLAGTWYDPDVITALEKIVSNRWGVHLPEPPKAALPTRGYGAVVAITPFRRLWIGQAVSYFGDMMNTTGLAIMLFMVTRSPVMVALGLIAKAIPVVLFGLVAGPIVDRFNRQRVMIAADVLRAVLTVTIPFFAIRWLPGVFFVVALVSAASTFFNPAKQAILPNLVPPAQLVKANSLVTSSERLMEFLGYSVAGLIAAISWAPLFLVDAGTYLFSAISLLGVSDTVRTAHQQRLRIADDVVAGMRFVLMSPILRSTMTLTTMSAVFMGLTFPTLVALTYGSLRSGAAAYGLLEAVIGAGAAVGALTVPRLMSRYRAGILVLSGVAGFGAGYALTGLFPNILLAMIFLFACGAASTVYLIPLISVTQREAPDYIRGRVMSSRFLLAQTGLLVGIALAGPLTNRIGAPLVFVTAGSLLICAALVGLGFRNLRGATLRDEPAVPVLKAVSG